MKKKCVILVVTTIFMLSFLSLNEFSLFGKTKKSISESDIVPEAVNLYNDLDLKNAISLQAFKIAYIGYLKFDIKNKSVMTVIDFSKPSTKKRLCVIDMKNKKTLFSSVVAHGRNSGENYATSFSNKPGSHKSSPGFYITENTYDGRNGYSLVLEGLEKGINDKAKERAIVIHGADYCDPNIIASTGRLGRSFGCPALPIEIAAPIIDTIKDGSLIYIYPGKKIVNR